MTLGLQEGAGEPLQTGWMRYTDPSGAVWGTRVELLTELLEGLTSQIPHSLAWEVSMRTRHTTHSPCNGFLLTLLFF